MGGIKELELSETSERDNIMDFSRDQGTVASNQAIPANTNITGSESTNEFERGSENSLETDDGMAWINWDLFLTDLNSSDAML